MIGSPIIDKVIVNCIGNHKFEDRLQPCSVVKLRFARFPLIQTPRSLLSFHEPGAACRRVHLSHFIRSDVESLGAKDDFSFFIHDSSNRRFDRVLSSQIFEDRKITFVAARTPSGKTSRRSSSHPPPPWCQTA